MKCGMRTFENLTNVYTKRSKVSMCVGVCICASTQNDIVQSNSTYTHSVFNLIPLWLEAEWKQFCNFALRLDQFGTVLPLETLNNVRSKWWTLNSEFIAAKDGTFTKTRIGHNCSTWVSLVLWVISVLKTSRQLHYKASVHKHQIKSWPISERIR